MSDRLNILVTGASGLVGAETTSRLVRAGHHVYGLVHNVGDIVANNGRRVSSAPWTAASARESGVVRLLTGDVTRPRFGLDNETWSSLSASLDRIVHCAAITDFGRSPEIYQQINVTGTVHALELAQENATPFVHVSTAYVCGNRDGVIAENELDVGQRFGNAYEESKMRAELIVRKAAADGLPATVVRPSVVTGTVRSGRVREFKNIYIVLKLLSKGLVSAIPGHFDACVDLVPVDHVAAVLTAATEDFDRARDLTLHAVGAPVRMRDVSDTFAEYPSFHVPRYLDPNTFTPDCLSRVEKKYYERVVSLYDNYFLRRQRFDSAIADRFVRRPSTAGSSYLRRLIDYALKAGYLGSTLPVADRALTPLKVGER
jgi:thioester reductase-like protein